MGYIVGQMVIDMKDNLKMIWEMDLAQCIGMMVHFIRDNGNRGFKMEKECYQSIKK